MFCLFPSRIPTLFCPSLGHLPSSPSKITRLSLLGPTHLLAQAPGALAALQLSLERTDLALNLRQSAQQVIPLLLQGPNPLPILVLLNEALGVLQLNAVSALDCLKGT